MKQHNHQPGSSVHRYRRWSGLPDALLVKAATTFVLFDACWSCCERCYTDVRRRAWLGTWYDAELCVDCWPSLYELWLASHPDGGTIPGRPPKGFKIRKIDRIGRAA